MYKRVVGWLGSRKFFVVTLGLFVFEAGWIAMSARYPMAFDEDFHLGLIRLYAHHLSPFFAHQPAGANVFGAVVRDPSYLYHYLMSFPWRLIAIVTHSFTTQVIMMRGLNIAFVVAGLVILRRVLAYTKASPAVINTVLLFLVLTPLVPFVAAQINYDNLLFLLVMVAMKLTCSYLDKLRRAEFSLKDLLGVIIVCLLASLEKYSFLPIFAALIVYLAVATGRAYWPAPWSRTFQAIQKSWRTMFGPTKLILGVLFVITFGLFLERDGYNTLRYGTPAPECDQVIGAAACAAYGPWQRNNVYLLTKDTREVNSNPASFGHTWLSAYYYSLFSVLNGPESNYVLGTALPVPYYMGEVVAVVGLLAALITWWQLRQRYRYLGLLVWVTLVYGAVLWLQNYEDFVHLGESTALQGRYLLLVLPFVYVMMTVGIKQVIERFGHRAQVLKPLILGVLLLLMLQGGGVLTFIVRSGPDWYWRDNQTAIRVNHAAQRLVKPFILGAARHP